MKHTVTVLGEGAWGTAISTVLAHNGHTVKLWCHDPQVVETIKTSRINQRYMPDIKLSNSILPTVSLEEALEGVQLLFVAIPVKYLRSVVNQAKPFVRADQAWIALSKGIEQETLMFPTEIIDNAFGTYIEGGICVGPSFAREVVRKQFTGMVLSAPNKEQSAHVKQLLENEYIRIYETTDIVGPQVGSALKNVIALGVGILEGAGYGQNTRAFVLTRALQDMVTCAQALGGEKETIYGLSGVGDLVLTCMGGLSRNVMVGKCFGQGQSLEKVIEEKGVTPEGVNTTKSIYKLAQKYNMSLPVCQGIYDMVFEGKSVDEFLAGLP